MLHFYTYTHIKMSVKKTESQESVSYKYTIIILLNCPFHFINRSYLWRDRVTRRKQNNNFSLAVEFFRLELTSVPKDYEITSISVSEIKSK